MNGAGAQVEVEARSLARDRKVEARSLARERNMERVGLRVVFNAELARNFAPGSDQFASNSAEQRRLDGVDANWVACYQEKAALRLQQSRASTRFP